MIRTSDTATSTRLRRLPAPVTAIPVVARGQLRQTRGMLLAIGATVLLAVTLTAAVPPFSNVMLTAALRAALTAAPDSDRLVVSTTPFGISSDANQLVTAVNESVMHTYLGGYLSSERETLVQLPGLHLSTPLPLPPGKNNGPPLINNTLTLIGATTQTAQARTSIIQGRLPQDGTTSIEIALTADTAEKLGTTVGGMLAVSVVYTIGSLTPGLPPRAAAVDLQLPVVGIFTTAATDDPFLNAANFSPQPSNQGYAFTVLASQGTLLGTMDRIAASVTTEVGTPGGTSLRVLPSAVVFQVYRLDVAHIRIDQLDDLITAMNAVQLYYSNAPVNPSDFASSLTGGPLGVGGSLEVFRSQAQFPRLVVGLFLLQIVALVELFILVLADVLVERQEVALALLRSRGATRAHIFAALGLQGIAVAAVAALVGMLLAIPVALWLAGAVLPAAEKSALNVITEDVPGQVLAAVPYALGTAGVAIVALLLFAARAARLNVLALRRETGRSSWRPVWQRLYLDVVAALIALVAFAVLSYLTGTLPSGEQSRVLLAPLALAVPVLLAVAVTLLAIRLFPWALRGAAWLAARSRGPAVQLAFAHLARAPGQSLRTALLLAFSLALVMVTAIFAASQTQRLPDVATYQAVADFSGTLPLDARTQTFDALSTQYRQISGVTSATLGYVHDAYQGALASNVELQAVDTATYAQTVRWPWLGAPQSVAAIVQRIVPRGALVGGVPALVDANLWNALHLRPGQSFTLDIAEAAAGPTANHSAYPFIAVAEVQHLPPLADDTAGVSSSDVVSGGVLVDYQTYAAYYKELESSATITPNYVWVRTVDDPATLAGIRTTLTQGSLPLNPLYDRRAILTHLQQDALYLDLTSVPALGALVTLGLGVIGIGVSTWQSAGRRFASFVVLRTLGLSRGQLVGMLWWEQIVTYALALGLGSAMGLGLAGMVARSLVFTGNTAVPVPGFSLGVTSTDEFFARQHVPPVRIVYPEVIAILVAGLFVLGLVLATLIAWRVSMTASGATLRFDED